MSRIDSALSYVQQVMFPYVNITEEPYLVLITAKKPDNGAIKQAIKLRKRNINVRVPYPPFPHNIAVIETILLLNIKYQI